MCGVLLPIRFQRVTENKDVVVQVQPTEVIQMFCQSKVYCGAIVSPDKNCITNGLECCSPALRCWFLAEEQVVYLNSSSPLLVRIIAAAFIQELCIMWSSACFNIYGCLVRLGLHGPIKVIDLSWCI